MWPAGECHPVGDGPRLHDGRRGRTRRTHQLEGLVADLPPHVDRRPLRWFGVARDLRDFAVIAVAAAVALQGLSRIWLLWPIAVGVLLPLALLGHRLPGRPGERDRGELPGGTGGSSVG